MHPFTIYTVLGKKEFEFDDDNDDTHTITQSTTDPESGEFHKGEHEKMFAYSAHTICDKNGFVLGCEVWKELYPKRKETIERVFGDAKEKHGMRYTQLRGQKKVGLEVLLIFACINLKKLAK